MYKLTFEDLIDVEKGRIELGSDIKETVKDYNYRIDMLVNEINELKMECGEDGEFERCEKKLDSLDLPDFMESIEVALKIARYHNGLVTGKKVQYMIREGSGAIDKNGVKGPIISRYNYPMNLYRHLFNGDKGVVYEDDILWLITEMAKLSDEEVRALRLHFEDGMTYGGIRDIMGMSYRDVEKMMNKVYKTLRDKGDNR